MELLPKLKELLPANNEYNDNCKKWIFANIAMSQAVIRYNAEVVDVKYGSYPMLSNGSYGFVFGYDNDYENHHFKGVYNYEENGVWLLINNYRILEESQFWTVNQWDKCMRAMSDAVMRKMADEKNTYCSK